MKIGGKIFLQFLASWMFMPLAFLVAQISGVAQEPEFITTTLLISSIAPVQVYLNEVYVPLSIKYRRRLGLRHTFEVAFAVAFLAGCVMYRAHSGFATTVLILLFVQGYIWFSYLAAQRILVFQSSYIIRARYSFIFGSIIPLVFNVMILFCWAALHVNKKFSWLIYCLLLLPNALQWAAIKFFGKWNPPSFAICEESMGPQKVTKEDPGSGLWIYFLLAVSMAFVAQYWKIELVYAATGFSAISVYLLSPFSSMWLIYSKSVFMTNSAHPHNKSLFWGSIGVVWISLLWDFDFVGYVFLAALLVQVLTFKFITDTRLRIAPNNEVVSPKRA